MNISSKKLKANPRFHDSIELSFFFFFFQPFQLAPIRKGGSFHDSSQLVRGSVTREATTGKAQ